VDTLSAEVRGGTWCWRGGHADNYEALMQEHLGASRSNTARPQPRSRGRAQVHRPLGAETWRRRPHEVALGRGHALRRCVRCRRGQAQVRQPEGQGGGAPASVQWGFGERSHAGAQPEPEAFTGLADQQCCVSVLLCAAC
jgi:hypothetical protein